MNDVCEYNITRMADENLRKIQPGSGKSEVCSFSTHCLSNIQRLWGHIALLKASTRCQQSLERKQRSTVKWGVNES